MIHMGGGYAVIDVETTGLWADGNDRVVEVAVVGLDPDGNQVSEWCTLVNPMRDLGPQHIHRITAAEVRTAPTFAEIAGDLGEQLAGRVLVAHNLSFDARFVQAEYGRLGSALALLTAPGLCTMRLANQFLSSSSRKLAACCAAAGVPLTDAHSALHDARATAGLMHYYLSSSRNHVLWQQMQAEASGWRWPLLPAPSGRLVSRGHLAVQPTHFLARLVDRLPRVPDPPQADDYLAVLDNALLDRFVSASEQDALVEVAAALDLSRSEVVALHRSYLLSLARAAWADGVVTEEERADLLLVATLLDLTVEDVDQALASGGTAGPVHAGFALRPGDQVVFTGQTHMPRETLEAAAAAAGLAVIGHVTKKTRLVVAADPDSLSRKAEKARGYGLPVITEDAFLSMVERLDKENR